MVLGAALRKKRSSQQTKLVEAFSQPNVRECTHPKEKAGGDRRGNTLGQSRSGAIGRERWKCQHRSDGGRLWGRSKRAAAFSAPCPGAVGGHHGWRCDLV